MVCSSQTSCNIQVNYRALVWALVVSSQCSAVVSLSSTGTLDPAAWPGGSLRQDYYMVTPSAVTFWGHPQIGAFEVPAEGREPDGCPVAAGVGRIHYSPADAQTRAVHWCTISVRCHHGRLQVKFTKGQTESSWPLISGRQEMVYVNTVGPRFETRAEIRSYKGSIGHVVGMTAGNEWMLCEELQADAGDLSLAKLDRLCCCDNACNGLSNHPQGALQEYLENKHLVVADVTAAVVYQLVEGLTKARGR
eukprot:Skav224294  [mRNA]  locus=scaffold2121:3207:11971:+ [translate_table: standard]